MSDILRWVINIFISSEKDNHMQNSKTALLEHFLLNCSYSTL